MIWRPEGWLNPHQGEVELLFPRCCIGLENAAYEAGADAMAKHLVLWIEQQGAKEIGFDSWQEMVEADAATIPDFWLQLRKEAGLE